jgi:hypothetical protein
MEEVEDENENEDEDDDNDDNDDGDTWPEVHDSVEYDRPGTFKGLHDFFVTHPNAPVMAAYEPFRCSSKVLDRLILAELREFFKDPGSAMRAYPRS